MGSFSLSPEEIESNWKKFRALCSKLGDRTESVSKMLDELEERFIMCPASTRLEHHSAYPGGLVDHSLRVIGNSLIVSKTFFPDVRLSKESLILVSGLHDVGKIGNETIENYVIQDSPWHREKLGEMYRINDELAYMTHAHRSVYMLQRFGVRLTEEEYIAILVHDGPSLEENRKYMMKESVLATVLSISDILATKQEKLNQTSI